MVRKGWIKEYRKSLDDLKELSDQEYRYYKASLLLAVWDKRSNYFGTFDARTRIIKSEILPHWAVGKINMTKNSLLDKGYYQKTEDRTRLKITNGEMFLGRRRDAEYFVQNVEKNLHKVEKDFQHDETQKADIRKMIGELARSKSVFPPDNSID